MVTVAFSLYKFPSLDLNVKLSEIAVSEELVYVATEPLSSKFPFWGWSTISNVNESLSGSVPVRVISFATCSSTVTLWSVAKGASLTGVILIVTVLGLLYSSESLTLNLKLSLVAVFDELTYVTVAPVTNETEPFKGCSTISNVNGSLSGSVPERLNSFETCSVTWIVWAVAVGASLTAVMLIVTFTIGERSPSGSFTLNSKLSLVAVSELLI